MEYADQCAGAELGFEADDVAVRVGGAPEEEVVAAAVLENAFPQDPDLASVMREHMFEQGLTQKDLAEKLGVA